MDNKKTTIRKSLKVAYDKGYEAGIRQAMSIVVNHFNCEEFIRQGVLKMMLNPQPKNT